MTPIKYRSFKYGSLTGMAVTSLVPGVISLVGLGCDHHILAVRFTKVTSKWDCRLHRIKLTLYLQRTFKGFKGERGRERGEKRGRRERGRIATAPFLSCTASTTHHPSTLLPHSTTSPSLTTPYHTPQPNTLTFHISNHTLTPTLIS